MLQRYKELIKVEAGFIRFQNAMLITTTVLLFSSVFVSVVMRYVLHMSMAGLEELIAICAMWSYFIGAGSVSISEDHITADILSFTIKNQLVLRRMKSFSWLLRAVLSVVFLMFAISFLKDSITLVTRTPQFRIPYFFSYFSVVYGAVIMCVYTIKHAVDFFRSKPSASAEEDKDFSNGGGNI